MVSIEEFEQKVLRIWPNESRGSVSYGRPVEMSSLPRSTMPHAARLSLERAGLPRSMRITRSRRSEVLQIARLTSRWILRSLIRSFGSVDSSAMSEECCELYEVMVVGQ